jgi:hypothetical protein
LHTTHRKMNRKLGQLLAMIFGLTLFFEVACLPVVSTLALQVEKSVMAEVNELADKDLEKTIELFSFLAPVYFVTFSHLDAANDLQPQVVAWASETLDSAPAFILHHALRI